MTDTQLTGWDVIRRMKAGDTTAEITLDMWVTVRSVIVRHARDKKRGWARDLHFDREYNALCVQYAHRTCRACPAQCRTRLDEFRQTYEDFLYSRVDVTDLLHAVDAMINVFTALVYNGPAADKIDQLKNEEVQEVVAMTRQQGRTGSLVHAV